jgi:hypothetical protein
VKVGDLVRIRRDKLIEIEEQDLAIGIVVAFPPKRRTAVVGRAYSGRVGIRWNDENLRRIDWEPMSWLEVISESR